MRRRLLNLLTALSLDSMSVRPHIAPNMQRSLLSRRCSLLSVFLLVIVTSCGRRSPAQVVKPRAAAYSDGFEVVVYEAGAGGAASNVRSLPLREAERAIAAGATAALPADPTHVTNALSAGKSGNFRAHLTGTPAPGGKQNVRVSFHESNRTFVYEYVGDGNTVIPSRSEHRDFAKSTAVQYSDP